MGRRMRVAAAIGAIGLLFVLPGTGRGDSIDGYAGTSWIDNPLVPCETASIGWRDSSPRGKPFRKGRLVRGVQLPADGDFFFTWNFPFSIAPNEGWRRWGVDGTIREVLTVLCEFRMANPDGAPGRRRRHRPHPRRLLRCPLRRRRPQLPPERPRRRHSLSPHRPPRGGGDQPEPGRSVSRPGPRQPLRRRRRQIRLRRAAPALDRSQRRGRQARRPRRPLPCPLPQAAGDQAAAAGARDQPGPARPAADRR